MRPVTEETERHRDGRWCDDLHCSRCYCAKTWQESEVTKLRARLATAEAERDEARRLVNEAHNARLHAQGAAGFCICAVCEAYRDSGISRRATLTPRETP
jgi:hypothetical protein